MRRSKADWFNHIKQQESSGLGVSRYCRENSLNVNSFYQHRRKAYSGPIPAPKGFAEIMVRQELLLTLDPDGTVTISRIQPELIPSILRVCSHALSR